MKASRRNRLLQQAVANAKKPRRELVIEQLNADGSKTVIERREWPFDDDLTIVIVGGSDDA
ncbi:MAG: hypothetical protein B6D64_13540 [Bacteroidetes bacterium 4484_276]|nr:MAG: hypothetical protein B6D64_13540 [Bacteroidetes bacterium 4484_276]